MKKQLLLIFLISLLGKLSIAQDFDVKKLDRYFDTLQQYQKFMGSIAVSQHGKLIYSRSVGYVDVESKQKANQNSIYRIGSISKTFTTVLVMKAIEKRSLTLDETIDKYFPSLQNANKITIEELLRHRSGIHNFTNDEAYLTWNTQPKTEQEMLSIIQEGGSDFEPGTKAEYSNSNFVLLSYILEKAFRKPYPELIKKHITQPLGLTHTYVGGKIYPRKNEAKSYSFMNDWQLETETDMSIPMGAGSIVSTPTDLVKFSDALFTGKLVQPAQLEQMKKLQAGFGMGLFQFPFENNFGYGHTGGIDGFSSVFSYFPDSEISYAITANGTNYSLNDISLVVLSAVFNKPYEIPSFTTYAVTASELQELTGVYSSPNFPLKITITTNDNKLIAQATGQSSFPLEAPKKNIFRFGPAGIELNFNPAENTMILKQGGGEYILTKE